MDPFFLSSFATQYSEQQVFEYHSIQASGGKKERKKEKKDTAMKNNKKRK